jgi:membrane protein required for colicin V production
MDVLLVGFIAGLTFAGLRRGFLHTLAGLFYLAIAFVLGAWLSGPFGDLVSQFLPDVPPDYASLVGYALVFPIVIGVLHALTYPLLRGRRMSSMTVGVDKVLGAIFGFLEAVLIISAVVVIFDTYFAAGQAAGSTPGLNVFSGLAGSLNSSYTVQLLRATTVPLVLTLLGPLLPRDISSLIPGGLPGMPGIPGGLPGVPGLHGVPGLPTPRH